MRDGRGDGRKKFLGSTVLPLPGLGVRELCQPHHSDAVMGSREALGCLLLWTRKRIRVSRQSTGVSLFECCSSIFRNPASPMSVRKTRHQRGLSKMLRSRNYALANPWLVPSVKSSSTTQLGFTNASRGVKKTPSTISFLPRTPRSLDRWIIYRNRKAIRFDPELVSPRIMILDNHDHGRPPATGSHSQREAHR